MYVEDAVGQKYCFTVAENTDKNKSDFRKHAAWWKRYVRSHDGQKAYRNTTAGSPCFPVKTVIEEY